MQHAQAAGERGSQGHRSHMLRLRSTTIIGVGTLRAGLGA